MEAKCVGFCLWQVSSHRRELLFGVSVESVTENWRALCHKSQLTANTGGDGLVCEFVVLVLKSIKVQGMMLKIEMKDL